uniref:Uncharacterized protein n=1 Tax=Panagrolaimus sp. ES5 TaxID=591445 RepID=A0AC34GP29_9BILA
MGIGKLAAAHRKWRSTFPADPNAEPSKFFHRLSVLAISNYCHGRNILPTRCLKKRSIEGNRFYSFVKDAEGGGKELYAAAIALSKVSRVTFLICGQTVDNPIESLNFNIYFDPLIDESPDDPAEALAQLKKATFAQLNHLIAVARALPSIPASQYPLHFRMRYEVIESAKEKEEGPPNPNFKVINVDPTVHQLYGAGANDLAFRSQLARGERMDIWYYSIFIQSSSEIDSVVAELDRTSAGETTTTDFNSTLNLDDTIFAN